MTDLIVTDTSCLIALDRIGHLDLLPALFTVHAPPAVLSEFGQRPSWLHAQSPPDLRRVEELREELDRGRPKRLLSPSHTTMHSCSSMSEKDAR